MKFIFKVYKSFSAGGGILKNIRLQKFRDYLSEKNIDGAFIFSDTNRNYLSGFKGDESYILVTLNEAFFITDSRYTEQAKNEVNGFEVKEYKNSIIDFVKDLAASLNIKSLGIEENFMTVKMYKEIKDALKDIELISLNECLEKQRQVKYPEEIENIKKAAQISDMAFSHILNFIKPGITEAEIGLELEFFMRKNGASKLSFPSIIASGKRSSLPHGVATQKIIEKGDLLTLDFGCVYNGYCSDMTRTVVVGSASEKQKEIYNIVLKANEEALKAIKPGNTGFDADKVARDIIEEYGYGQNFGHGLGHGVGMDIHELPRLSKKGLDELKANMVVTDEPGIYLPGFGGVRIEDLVLVTEDGCEVLSKSNKQLVEL